jgi:hypothetical protein
MQCGRATNMTKRPVAVSVIWIHSFPAKSSVRSRLTLRAVSDLQQVTHVAVHHSRSAPEMPPNRRVIQETVWNKTPGFEMKVKLTFLPI